MAPRPQLFPAHPWQRGEDKEGGGEAPSELPDPYASGVSGSVGESHRGLRPRNTVITAVQDTSPPDWPSSPRTGRGLGS